MSFYDAIDRLVRNSQDFDWDYYHCHDSCSTVEDVFNYPNSFIGETFIYARKQLLLSTHYGNRYNFDSPNITDARAAHSISSFYTGYLLAQGLLGNNVNRFCEVYKTENGRFTFSYVWNLTCLYHDFGYEFEENADNRELVKKEVLDTAERKHNKNSSLRTPVYDRCAFPAISKVFSIHRTHLSVDMYSGLNKDDSAEYQFIRGYLRNYKNQLLCNGAPVKCPNRTAQQVERYLSYRLLGREPGCVDHGIMGGLSFYNLITENYIKEFAESRNGCGNQDFTRFDTMNMLGNPLRVAIEQTVLFAYIADCIVNHNIWKAPKGCEGLYRTFGLDALVGSKFKKISFYKNPLLFLLVMADCLEPYKNYCRLCCGHGIDDWDYAPNEAISIFKEYDLTVEDGRIVITVPDSWIVACEKRLSEMKDWISMEYEKRSNEFYITPLNPDV